MQLRYHKVLVYFIERSCSLKVIGQYHIICQELVWVTFQTQIKQKKYKITFMRKLYVQTIFFEWQFYVVSWQLSKCLLQVSLFKLVNIYHFSIFILFYFIWVVLIFIYMIFSVNLFWIIVFLYFWLVVSFFALVFVF